MTSLNFDLTKVLSIDTSYWKAERECERRYAEGDFGQSELPEDEDEE